MKIEWQWIEQILDWKNEYKNKLPKNLRTVELSFGITFQKNIRFYEIWIQLGIGKYVIAFERRKT